MKKDRVVSLDLMRFFAFFLIIAYHFMVELEKYGAYSFAEWKFYYSNANMHIATLGVGLFFVLSGFGLGLSGQKEFQLKEYMKKRFFKILVPFYITYLLDFLYSLIMEKNLNFFKGIPVRRLWLTLLGMDGYASVMQIRCFSLGIGEWFLGCLMLMYFLYPLLQKILRKAPLLLVTAAGALYAYIVFDYHYTLLPVHMNFFVKLYEFILGMYLATVYKRIPRWTALPASFTACVFMISKDAMNLPEGAKITLLTLCVFIAFLALEKPCSEMKLIPNLLKLFSDYSYELFLVHHIVIFEIGKHFIAGHLLSTKRMLAWAAGEFALMAVLALIVHLLQNQIRKLAYKKREQNMG